MGEFAGAGVQACQILAKAHVADQSVLAVRREDHIHRQAADFLYSRPGRGDHFPGRKLGRAQSLSVCGRQQARHQDAARQRSGQAPELMPRET